MFNVNDCINIIHKNQLYIQKEYGVTALCLFGSMSRGDNGPHSDVDILVDMPPKIFIMSALKGYLENLLGMSVDLIRRHSHLSQRFLNQISNDAITVF